MCPRTGITLTIPFIANRTGCKVPRGPVLSRETSCAQRSLSGSWLERKAGSLPRKEIGLMARCKFCKGMIKNPFHLICFCQLQLPAIGGSCPFISEESLPLRARRCIIFLIHS